MKLNRKLKATGSLSEAVAAADVLILGVPSQAMRNTAAAVRKHIRPWVPVISLAKGFEAETGLRMTQVIGQELPGHPLGVLTGPNLAKEILAGMAAASVTSEAQNLKGYVDMHTHPMSYLGFGGKAKVFNDIRQNRIACKP